MSVLRSEPVNVATERAVKPLVISMGDPAGVGPELALRGAEWCRARRIPVAIAGSALILQRVAAKLDLPVPAAITADDWRQASTTAVEPVIVDLVHADDSRVVPGKVTASTGEASLAYVNFGIDESLAGRAAGIVTGPIHKEAWHAAGSVHPGHTELLAERSGAERHCMMLAAPSIRCALVTAHLGLREVASVLSIESVRETIELAGDAVSRMIGKKAAITVLGLNPHAGEGGLFGDCEEERLIVPGMTAAAESGWAARGPLPPDTAFLPKIRAETDVFICMYHDQGLIPLKALAFEEAINVTLGLPFVRTSVDHGTALDLAWQGTASVTSMLAALDMAYRLTSSSNGATQSTK